MNNDDILTCVSTVIPNLIYVAIGCARNPNQQCPPQVRMWPGRKLCILIDPMLESPPLVHSDSDTTIVPVYRNFEWSSQDDIDFIRALCRFTAAHMIVQDYTGLDIYPYYPGLEFTKRVLFDITYGDGGCYVDFNTIQILQDDSGNFIQPHFATLTQLSHLPAAIRKPEVMTRRNHIINYIHYYYRMKSHATPADDWLSTVSSYLQHHVEQFALIYGTPATITLDNLRTLIDKVVQDLSIATNVEIPPSDMKQIIDTPERNVFGNAIGTLCNLLN